MVSIDNARIATCIAAAALAGASAVAFPSVARADEGSDPAATLPLPDVPAAPVVEAGSTTGGEETDALGDVITAALDSAGVVDGAPAASPSPEPRARGRGERARAGHERRSRIHDGLRVRAADLSKPRYQRVLGRYHGRYRLRGRLDLPPGGDVSPPVAVQTAPSNLNVSVRIDSPGDNGAVTQVNIATAAAIGASNAAAPSSPTPVATQASAPSSASAGANRPATAISSPGSATSSDVDPATDTWAWQWDCLSAPPLTAISPNSSTSGSGAEELDVDLELRR